MTLERGTLLHKRYRIVEILGQGGMGSVYRAVDENLGVDVAVKENLFTTDEYARQFRLEAVILANLRQANLPRVTDHFVIGDQGQYLVMDYIEGEDLRQRMERQGTIPEEDAILIGAAMCDALQYLHTRKPPILHRDVKPGNVKITPDGHIFLVDFGLAKVVQGSQATTTGARAMTPGYSPPEQYGTARTDPRTDIYSLGATLYAALTGVIPEDGLARAMDNAQLTPLRKRNPSVSRRLASAIEKAMGVRPEDRYQSGDEFKKALLGASSKSQRQGEFFVPPPPPAEDIEDEEPEEQPPAKPVSKPGLVLPEVADKPVSKPRKKRRSRSGCLVPLLVVLLLVVGGSVAASLYYPNLPGTVMAWFSQSPASPDATKVPATEDVPPDTGTAEVTDVTVEPTATLEPTPAYTPAPAITPMGGGYGQIAFASDRSGVMQIYVINEDGSDLRPVTNVSDGACQPSWSPDGQRLVFISPCMGREDFYRDTALFIINMDGTGLTPLPTVPGGDFEPDWSPDGKEIAFTSLRDGYMQIYSINLDDQNVTNVHPTSRDFESRQPDWSPFGDQIAFTAKRYDQSYQVWTMRSDGQSASIFARSGPDFWDFLPTWSPDGQSIIFTQRRPGNAYMNWFIRMDYQDRGAITSSDKFDVGMTPVLDAEYSPDGTLLVFEGIGENDQFDIFTSHSDGTELQRLTTDKALDIDPTWRPAQ